MYDCKSFPLLDREFRLTAHTSRGPLSFEVVTPRVALGYEFGSHAEVIRFTTLRGDSIGKYIATSTESLLKQRISA